jgi:hypothetical protein
LANPNASWLVKPNLQVPAAMESVELCARLSRLARSDRDPPQQPSAATNEARAALDAVVAFYDDAASPREAANSAVAGVDDLVLMALQRLLLTTLRGGYDSATQERAFVALALLVRRCEGRLTPTRLVDLLQAAALYLPPPAAAIDPTTTATSDAVQTKPPEELALTVLEALHTLLAVPTADHAVQQLTRSQDTTHFTAYIVSSLLQLAERERNRHLALLSVHVLQRLLACVARADVRVLRMFFPGVAVGMWKTMSAPLQASKVVVAALECVSSVLPAALGDAHERHTNALASPQYSLEQLRQHQHTTPPATPPTTGAWVAQAADKVDVLLSHILSSTAMDRQPWRVRRALVDLCGAVVCDCRASLSASFFRCFEELMVLATHAIADVAQAAEATLVRLTQELPLDEWLALESQFAARFEMQLSTLELQCGTEQESVSVHTMEVLIGYLQFQKQQLRFRRVVDDTMDAIFRALVHVVAFSGFDIDLLRHERQHARVVPYFQKRFRHFHDDATVAVAIRLLRNVGAVATPAVVVDTAMALLQTERDDRDAVLVILNECLRAQIQDHDDHIHLVGRVLDDLLALPLWASTRARDKNTTALLVECVGVCVELSGAAFADFLLYALYPLVEKLGDAAIQVEQAALTTLQRIAVECGGGGDLHALFSDNMDYLVDALCARLEQLELYPQSPQVVEALLRHATVASLPLVDEMTRSLLRAVDMYQDAAPETTMMPLLKSLQLLLTSFATAESRTSDGEGAVQDGGETPPLTRFLLEMRAMTDPLFTESEDAPVIAEAAAELDVSRAMPVEYESDQGLDAENANEDDDDDKEPPPLPFQAQTVEILERCSYFVADADPMACCLVLVTIAEGVRYLRVRPTTLLPLIHRIWPSILHRLTVANRPILAATMELVATLAECAGDFIGDRFVETVWPSVKALLASIGDAAIASAGGPHATSLTRSMLLISTDDHGGDATIPQQPADDTREETATRVAGRSDRRVTLETKLLNATLRCLRKVSDNAATVTSLVPEITDSCALFLSPAFDASTVLLTQELLLALAVLNGDEVFVAMAALSQWQPPPPPSAQFPAYDGIGVRSPALGAALQARSSQKARNSREEARRQQLQRCHANAAIVLEQLIDRKD